MKTLLDILEQVSQAYDTYRETQTNAHDYEKTCEKFNDLMNILE